MLKNQPVYTILHWVFVMIVLYTFQCYEGKIPLKKTHTHTQITIIRLLLSFGFHWLFLILFKATENQCLCVFWQFLIFLFDCDC